MQVTKNSKEDIQMEMLVKQLAEKSSKRELDRLIGFIAGQLYKKTEEEQKNKKP